MAALSKHAILCIAAYALVRRRRRRHRNAQPQRVGRVRIKPHIGRHDEQGAYEKISKSCDMTRPNSKNSIGLTQLHTGSGNTGVNYEMGGTILSKTVKEKDLGVTMNANMKVSEQCRIAASKGNQVLGMIRRNITYKEKSLIIPLYKAIVRPHLEYCIQAWNPYLRKDVDMLEKIQRRATKLIPGLRDLTYEERLNECGLTTLETRRLRGDQIEVFKILNGYENIDYNIFFEIKESKITRGHNYTLVKKQSRLDVRKYSFSQRTINVWNNLSTDCVQASSVNMFKNKIDKYLVKAGYT